MKPSYYAELSSIAGTAEEKQKSTEENCANYCDNSAREGKIFSYEMNQVNVDSKCRVEAEKSSSNNLQPSEEKQKKMEINLEGSIRLPTEPIRQGSIDRSVLERNYDRSHGSLVKDVAKNVSAFGNFSNESNNVNMPVILNVFTLSRQPTFIKKKTTNMLCENNFPVTPPCSPPLSKLEKFTATRQLASFQNGSTTLEKAAITSNMYHGNICCSGKNGQKRMIHEAHVFPTEIKKIIHYENYTPEHEITKFYNANRVARRTDSELRAVSGTKVNAIFSGKWAPAVRKLNTQSLKSSPATELTETRAHTTATYVSEGEDGLTPQEIKVLHLKRRLQEQEAAIKRLRTNH